MNPTDPEFIALRDDVIEIKEALIGNALEGKTGVMHWHNQMCEDLYGVDSKGSPIKGKTNTLLRRMGDVEGNQKKIVWIGTGVLATCTAIKVGVWAFFGKIFEK